MEEEGELDVPGRYSSLIISGRQTANKTSNPLASPSPIFLAAVFL